VNLRLFNVIVEARHPRPRDERLRRQTSFTLLAIAFFPSAALTSIVRPFAFSSASAHISSGFHDHMSLRAKA
jgi:hypothetical protein